MKFSFNFCPDVEKPLFLFFRYGNFKIRPSCLERVRVQVSLFAICSRYYIKNEVQELIKHMKHMDN